MCISFEMAFVFKQKGSSYWYAGWKDENGKRVNRSTRQPNKQANRRQALKIADEFEQSSRTKKSVRQIRKTISDLQQDLTGNEMLSSTITEYFTAFIDMKKGESSDATVRLYQTCTRDLLGWLNKDIDRSDDDLDSISAQDVITFRNHMLTKVASSTANHKMKAIRAIFTKAVKEGAILEDPTASMNLGRKANRGKTKLEKRPFTNDEISLLLSNANEEWKSMIMFGIYTGQRLGDIAQLRWSNLDLKRNQFKIRTIKTDKAITIPMAQSLLKHIETLKNDNSPSSYVHPSIGETYERSGSSALSNQFIKILASCGLRKAVSHKKEKDGRDGKRSETELSFHCLRVTAVTMLHDSGIPAATVEQWVGHDSSEVHKVYIKTGTEALKKASDAIPDFT